MKAMIASTLSRPSEAGALATVESAVGEVWIIGAAWIVEADGCRTSGCVCCILTVALGSAGFAPSAGSVMRAVSFFGAAARCAMGSGAVTLLVAGGPGGRAADGADGIPGLGATGGAPGCIGSVGLPASVGGFGGGALIPLALPTGFGGPGGTAACEGGFGGGGMKGLDAMAGACGASAPSGPTVAAAGSATILVVSFFGVTPGI